MGKIRAVPRAALITGATSGIGRALALACARPGVVLHLGGRDAARLDAVAAGCAARGARVEARRIDVTDRARMAEWIGASGPLDLVIANAGISAGTGDGRPETPDQVRAIFAVNLDGALNTALPAADAMLAQPPGPDGWRGRIAVVSSVAAFVPGPGAPAYCASKAALDRWAIAAAPGLRARGVLLTSVCPGYIRTPMTARNRFPMPGIMGPDRAAAAILRGVSAGRRRVAFPWWVALLAHGVGALPPSLATWLLAIPPGKDPA